MIDSKRPMVPEWLPLKSDFVFKRVFGDTRNVDILTAFLKSVLDLPAEEYAKVTIIDPHVKKENIEDKAGVCPLSPYGGGLGWGLEYRICYCPHPNPRAKTPPRGRGDVIQTRSRKIGLHSNV